MRDEIILQRANRRLLRVVAAAKNDQEGQFRTG